MCPNNIKEYKIKLKDIQNKEIHGVEENEENATAMKRSAVALMLMAGIAVGVWRETQAISSVQTSSKW